MPWPFSLWRAFSGQQPRRQWRSWLQHHHGTSVRRGSEKLSFNTLFQPHIWLPLWHTLPFSNLLPIGAVGCSVPLDSGKGSTLIFMPFPTNCQGYSETSQTAGKKVSLHQDYLFLCMLCSVFKNVLFFHLTWGALFQSHTFLESFALKYLGHQVLQEWVAIKITLYEKNHLIR